MKKEQLISFKIPIQLYNGLKVRSKELGISMSSLIRLTLWEEVNCLKDLKYDK